MATRNTPTFSDVGLAYAKRFADLEHARDQFMRERRAILTELAAATRAALKEAKLKGTEYYVKKPNSKEQEPRDDVDTWTWYLDEKYARAWNAPKKKPDRKNERSGVELWLADVEGCPFSFCSLLWFSDEHRVLIGDDDADEEGVVRSDHELAKELVALGLVAEGNLWLYRKQILVVTSLLGVDGSSSFGFDGFVEHARRLPAQFRQVDELLAALFERVAGAEE